MDFLEEPINQTTRETYVLHNLGALGLLLTLGSITVFTAIGNTLVCVAVCMVRKLRRPANYLLVSLAVSDLCVALLVMPMALAYEVFGRWTFGNAMCDLWVAADILSCTASILNLCAISVDRFYAISRPFEYGVQRTPKRMLLCIGIVWLSALFISVPPLLILGNDHGVGGEGCTVSQNFWYQIYATLGSFYIPLTVMIFVYRKIYEAASKIVKEEKRAQRHLTRDVAPVNTGIVITSVTDNIKEVEADPSLYAKVTPSCGSNSILVPMLTPTPQSSPMNVKNKRTENTRRLRFILAKERKASTTLGIIMSAFILCWLPFFILALIRPFLDKRDIPNWLSSFFLWLGYVNSTLNPAIYATFHADFRRPFREILCFRCKTLNSLMREEYYNEHYGGIETPYHRPSGSSNFEGESTRKESFV